MPTIEERVAYLEGQVSEQSHALLEVRDAVRHLEQRMDARFESLERRFEGRFEAADSRFDATDRRIDALETRCPDSSSGLSASR